MPHDFQLNGRAYRLDPSDVRDRLKDLVREDIRDHWVEVDGLRWPVKQAFAAATALPRAAFTSHIALRHLRALGFPTSQLPSQVERGKAGGLVVRQNHEPHSTDPARAFATLLAFTESENLTTRIATLEAQLEGVDCPAAAGIVHHSALSPDLLHAALLVRKHAGRLNDIIHAAVITQVIPLILEDGERVRRRPSLAAGNDPTRPFDLETDRRIAEFKMSVWKGADTMRKRGVFADLVHLALDDSGRRAQLYVAGPLAIDFLRRGKSTALWALGRHSPSLRRRFEERYDSSDMSIREFTAGPAAHVELIDLTHLLPAINLAIS
jgi:hypothetical protein